MGSTGRELTRPSDAAVAVALFPDPAGVVDKVKLPSLAVMAMLPGFDITTQTRAPTIARIAAAQPKKTNRPASDLRRRFVGFFFLMVIGAAAVTDAGASANVGIDVPDAGAETAGTGAAAIWGAGTGAAGAWGGCVWEDGGICGASGLP